jgi:flagellar assembly protein FliH
MSPAKKFLFEMDFAANAAPAERPVGLAEHAVMIAEAESRGFAAGFTAADQERTAQNERRSATAFEQIADGIDRLARGLAEIKNQLEAEAVEVAVAVGRKLAPELIAREPFAEIAALATECFRQLVAAPHVVVRVNDALHDTARKQLEEIAQMRGFDGRLVVIAEPDIALGDCRIEWADGGLHRNRAVIESAVTDVVGRYLAVRSNIPG